MGVPEFFKIYNQEYFCTINVYFKVSFRSPVITLTLYLLLYIYILTTTLLFDNCIDCLWESAR